MSVDIDVVMNKLQSLETADELADLFSGYGIKAFPRQPNACAIAQFVKNETGLKIRTNTICTNYENEEGELIGEYYYHTDAMKDFIRKYDTGLYPDLIDIGYIENEMVSPYWSSGCTCESCN